jgi:hypothetical protein
MTSNTAGTLSLEPRGQRQSDWREREKVSLVIRLDTTTLRLGPKGRSMDDSTPISYLALESGTTVKSASGQIIGKVEHVLQIPEEDLFDGIVVTTDHGLRFVDRDQIREITKSAVHCTLTDPEVAELPVPRGTATFHADASQDVGASLTARFGRLFGRERWVKDS